MEAPAVTPDTKTAAEAVSDFVEAKRRALATSAKLSGLIAAIGHLSDEQLIDDVWANPDNRIMPPPFIEDAQDDATDLADRLRELGEIAKSVRVGLLRTTNGNGAFRVYPL